MACVLKGIRSVRLKLSALGNSLPHHHHVVIQIHPTYPTYTFQRIAHHQQLTSHNPSKKKEPS